MTRIGFNLNGFLIEIANAGFVCAFIEVANDEINSRM